MQIGHISLTWTKLQVVVEHIEAPFVIWLLGGGGGCSCIVVVAVAVVVVVVVVVAVVVAVAVVVVVVVDVVVGLCLLLVVRPNIHVWVDWMRVLARR